MPRSRLQGKVDYYKEVETDHREEDDDLKGLKNGIFLQSEKFSPTPGSAQGSSGMPSMGYSFVEAWKPSDLILTSLQKARDQTHVGFVVCASNFISPKTYLPV